MKKIAILLFGLNFFTSFAQSLYYAAYDWKQTPEKYVLSEAEQKEDEVIVYEKRSEEYARINDQFNQFSLYHVVRVLNTNVGIERNNKVYISNDALEVLVQKARVIKPDGTILELKDADIREFKNEEGEVEYRYFALEGLEKGSVVEYLHYFKKEADLSGRSLTIQGEVLKRAVDVDIISPAHLDFFVHAVNGMPQLELDTNSTTDIRRKFAHCDNVKGQKSEYAAPAGAVAMKFFYKLQKNFDSGKGNFYTFNEAGKIVFDNNFGVPSKKSLKIYNTMIKDVNANGGSNLESKVRFLENKLKKEINIVDFNSPELNNPDLIFKNKLASEQGMILVMMQILREMGVKFELVLTTDRDELAFVPEFEGYNFLNEYLIYVNELDMYLDAGLFSRLGFPPYELTQTKGLFVSEKSLGDMKVPITKLKDIKAVDSKKSVDGIEAVVDFTTSLSEPKIVIERSVSGYKAIFPQFVLNFMDEKQREEAKKDVIQYIDEDAVIEEISYTNDNSDVAGVLPLKAKGTFVSHSFLEKAGDKTLLKIGALIGPQAELYHEEVRTMPVMTEFNREYQRVLKVKVPENVRLENLSALVMNEYTDDKSSGFESSYTFENGELVVTIREFYTRVSYTVEEYKQYERVMNAAADFNKLVIVVEPK
jgi:hypothetical protein